MNPSSINWLAVFVAAISAFLIGAIWYSPMLFAKPWMAANKFTETDLKNSNKGKTFGFSFIFEIIIAVNLAFFLATPTTTASWGATAGFLAGIWIFAGGAITALFENRSGKYILINGGYHLVALTLMGFIIGVWR